MKYIVSFFSVVYIITGIISKATLFEEIENVVIIAYAVLYVVFIVVFSLLGYLSFFSKIKEGVKRKVMIVQIPATIMGGVIPFVLVNQLIVALNNYNGIMVLFRYLFSTVTLWGVFLGILGFSYNNYKTIKK